ncbi:hypothetical protein HXX76_009768 [Chlamydomonas incerta]|uniref:DOT1 domain-containing protein n=1 Tax=Chlamydomonas incerta TaxID=51695 RepID=A0A835T3N7_CHLIN|nr:hypothetical protein HXX76_009768 [Chlamydomonas incerta]|eukprot:KAG2431240.1 hypothetical protein HXX76_009768 [Chlamydomonas incerta]
MPRAWLLLLSCVDELNSIDVTVRHRGLDGEGCEGTYGSITFRCLLKLERQQRQERRVQVAPASADAAAAAMSTWTRQCQRGPSQRRGLRERAPMCTAAAAAVGGGAEPGGVALPMELALAPVPPRPGRLVDFGAGTGRALVLLQCLNLVEAAVGFEVDGTKVAKAELYMTELVAAAAAAGRRSCGAASGSGSAGVGVGGGSGAGSGAGSSAAGGGRGGRGGGRSSGAHGGSSPGSSSRGGGGGSGGGGGGRARQLLGVVGGVGRTGLARGRGVGRGRARGRGRRGGPSAGTVSALDTDGADQRAAGPSGGPPQPQPQRMQVLGDLSLRADVPAVLQADLVQLTPAALAAHSPSWGYAFWAGVPPEAQAAIWRLFMGCDTMTTLLLVGYGDRSAATLSRLMAQWEQRQQSPAAAGGAVIRRVISGVASMGGNGCYSAFVLRKCTVVRRRAAVA